MKQTMENSKVENGTYYHPETPSTVIRALENARVAGYRVELVYGDVASGRAWDPSATPDTGTIGRSMGPMKSALLIRTRRSMGGDAILTHCIVAIRYTTGKRGYLYKHPTLRLTSCDRFVNGRGKRGKLDDVCQRCNRTRAEHFAGTEPVS